VDREGSRNTKELFKSKKHTKKSAEYEKLDASALQFSVWTLDRM